jgi:hypothetical protein
VLETICRNDERCGGLPGPFGYTWGRTVEGCMQGRMQYRGRPDRYYLWQEALDRGTATWNADRAAACLAWLGELPCDALDFDPEPSPFEALHPECRRLIDGMVSPSSACHIDEECLGGWCNTRTSCPGTCTATLPLGAGCSEPAECGPSAACSATTRTCVAAVPEFEGNEGDSCGGTGRWCAVGLRCDPYAGTCQPYLDEGDSCVVLNSCAPGLDCVADRCARVTLTSEEDAICGGTTACDPLAHLGCEPTSSAASFCRAAGEAGDECGRDGSAACREGLACSGRVCLALRPNGAPCIDAIQCVGGACLDGSCSGGLCDAPSPWWYFAP